MNKLGQQPQRPPNLGPTPNIGSFRPYQQAYGLPPRGVMPTYPTMQNHRAQGIVPQPSPGFIQQRTVGSSAGSAFTFAASMQSTQQQQAAVAQQSTQQQQQHHQQQPTSSLQQQPPPPQQQQPQPPPQSQPSSASTLPPHIAQQHPQQQNPPGQGQGQGLPSADVSLDPNDFPALGSGNTPGVAAAAAAASLHSSYATQAAPSVPGNSANGAPGAGRDVRDFGPDDFPALGGQQTQGQGQHGTPQTQTQGQGQGQGQGPEAGLGSVGSHQQQHPPGLNGFQQNDQQAQSLRQNLLGGSLQPQQQQRGLHTGTGYEADKRLNQNWPTGGNAPGSATSFPSNSGLANGSQQHIIQQPQQQASSQQQLNAPPGVPPPSTYALQQQQQSFAVNTTEGHHPSATTSATTSTTQAQLTSASSQQHLPQTPAQQILMSPADRWGLLGLLALIKSADPDMALLSIGADLANLGLNVGQGGNIYSHFITPWSDSAAAGTVEPEFHLPACYNVQPPPPGPSKVAAFSDETLFFMFYSSPRDALQEVAAQELWNRNWRWHKDLRHWLTKETGTPPSQKVPGGEAGTYTFWDPEAWAKERKDLTVLYADLEEKSIPAFVQGPGLQAVGGGGSGGAPGAGMQAGGNVGQAGGLGVGVGLRQQGYSTMNVGMA
ncbi:hypothetical protein BU17DRAFT_74080 [Hysterangium stoloniferum]|nr:hypothetical protein BU17DRAFT_74080 [Hysterangium stoloniferum]